MEPHHRTTMLVLVLLLGLLLASESGRTHKVQTEDECLSNTAHCFQCDSRLDPNCADPFEFPVELLGAAMARAQLQHPDSAAHNDNSAPANNNGSFVGPPPVTLIAAAAAANSSTTNATAASAGNSTGLAAKTLPRVALCHGCCVKITGRQPDGVSTYVRRACTTNFQINYFMVDLVCMKESGDRGRMCFCDNDLCNAAPTLHHHHSLLINAFACLVALAGAAGSRGLYSFRRPLH